MTFTFNPETYGTLLARYRAKTIYTDAENEQAIAWHRGGRVCNIFILTDNLLMPCPGGCRAPEVNC